VPHDNPQCFLVIGAGPAGLTAAAELLARGCAVTVVESDVQVGGISKTVTYKGNRIDIGGHRFFSKSDEVMRRWLELLPLQGSPARDDVAMGRAVPVDSDAAAPDPERDDSVMLSRTRLSRIYFLRKFFDYPVSLSAATLRNIGLARFARVGVSYVAARLRPVKPERTLEDFMVNRFGRELYELFFKDYTEKVWGVPCREIGPEWGAQRIKGVSVGSAVKHAVRTMMGRDDSVSQKSTETSLIGRFLYPKYGPGQLWEQAARRVTDAGGELLLRHEVRGLELRGGRVTSVRVADLESGEERVFTPDAVISSMPVRDLIAGVIGEDVPRDVRRVAEGLPYRDFITVGLLVRHMRPGLGGEADGRVRDNWIYIQERDVKLGRLQVFNNWSPYMVADDACVWLGLEYFCDEGDELWEAEDSTLIELGASELARIGMVEAEDVIDGMALRVRKAYPAYFGTYDEFSLVRAWLDTIENLVVVGRNGMHRYNNMDHSMLSAIAAVDALVSGGSRAAVWGVNAEEDYHEESA
jgi:protoporphyrinogen oxidase